MLGFTLIALVLTGLLFGLAPVVRASHQNPNAALQDGGARMAGSPERNRIRKVLVVAEIALALILLIGAGLLAKSFVLLRQTAIGFDPEGIVTASLTLPDASYPPLRTRARYLRQALERAAAMPEARAVGVVSALPLSRYGARVRAA